jgi:ribose/xylose/arabinose/galactoside ABC-type transport system permease subunit
VSPSGSATSNQRAATRVWRNTRFLLLRPELALPFITLALMLYLSLASPYFFNQRNLFNITETVAVLGIAAAFATIVVISGGIDLTPTVVFVIAGLVCYWTLQEGLPPALAIILGVLTGGGIGLMNGLFIALGNLNPFIVTLGTNFLFTGLGFVLTNGNAVLISSTGFKNIDHPDVIGHAGTLTIMMLVAFLLAFCLLRFTRFGVHVFAIGGDETAARLSGVPVARVKTLVYVAAGLASGAAGVFLAAAVGSVAPFYASGENDLLTILAAVIIGGTALQGGRGTTFGTLVGILLLAIISNGLVLENISSFWQPVIVGALLLTAIVLDEVRRRTALKVAR